MQTKETKRWMRGGGSLYCLNGRSGAEETDRKVVLSGRTWVIRPVTD